MALIQTGAVVNQIRGSVGGTVASRNLGGAYMRARVAPVNRRTPAQQAVRANFAINSKAWSGLLTADQRAAWTFFAQANPLVNVLGASIIVSGLAMYNKLNQVLSSIGFPNISDPPADLSVPTLAAIDGVVSVSGTQHVTINTEIQAVVADASYYIFAAPPMAAGKTASSSDFRALAAFGPSAAAVAIEVGSQFIARFGAFIAGQSISVMVATVNTASGAVTPALKYNTIAS